MPRTYSLRSFGRFSPYSSRSDAYEETGGESWNGTYRTLCVRLCDGYYFPVSYRTTRGRMHRDAKLCEASCDCETKLFYLPSSSSDIKSATDFSGQSYGRLENAFAYRKAWDLSCSCRPAPWSSAEKLRHEGYAVVHSGQQAEQQARKGEAMAGLIAREDAKDAETAAELLAVASGSGRRPVAFLKSRRALPDNAAPAPATAPVPPLAELPPTGEVEAPETRPIGQVALAEPVVVEPETLVDELVVTPAVPSESSRTAKKPGSAKKATLAAGRSQKPASRQGKAARSNSRGFFQM